MNKWRREASVPHGTHKWVSGGAKALSALLVMVLAGCVGHVADKKAIQTWGYASWWDPPTGAQLDRAHLDRIMFFQIEIGADGRIRESHGWPAQYQTFINAAAQRRLPLDITVTLQGKDDFEKLFSNPVFVHNLLETCVKLVDDGDGIAGLQLDFEVYDEVTPQSIASLREFVPRLANALHEGSPRRSLSVFVPANGEMLYDRASLANIDWGVMQSYDAHWANSPQAGPVAPLHGTSDLTWDHVVKTASALGLGPKRIVMTYPLYGYEWPTKSQDADARTTGPAAITTLDHVSADMLPQIQTNVEQRVKRYGCHHDVLSGSSFYRFRDPQKGWFVGWYEGAWSLGLKRQFVIDQKLAGMAFFVLGYDDYRLVGTINKSRTTAYAETVPQRCL